MGFMRQLDRREEQPERIKGRSGRGRHPCSTDRAFVNDEVGRCFFFGIAALILNQVIRRSFANVQIPSTSYYLVSNDPMLF
jgi:hypothetical protein